MLIGSEASASLFVLVEGLIPETARELDIFLSGLSFSDNGEAWSVAMSRVPLRYEIPPAE